MNTEKIALYGAVGLAAWIGFQAIARYNAFGQGVGDTVHALFGGGIGENLGNKFWNAPAFNLGTKLTMGPGGIPYNATNDLKVWDARYAQGYPSTADVLKGVLTVNVPVTDQSFGKFGYSTSQIEWAQMHYEGAWNQTWMDIVNGRQLTPEEQAMVNGIPSIDF